MQMGSTGTPSLAGFLDRGGWSIPCLAALPPAKETGTPCSGGWVGPSASWTHAENIPSPPPAPDHPFCSGWLCQLSYPAPQFI
jgi:hypothetical protein